MRKLLGILVLPIVLSGCGNEESSMKCSLNDGTVVNALIDETEKSILHYELITPTGATTGNLVTAPYIENVRLRDESWGYTLYAKSKKRNGKEYFWVSMITESDLTFLYHDMMNNGKGPFVNHDRAEGQCVKL